MDEKKILAASLAGLITVSTVYHYPGEDLHSHKEPIPYVNTKDLANNAVVSGTNIGNQELPDGIKNLGSNPDRPEERLFLVSIPYPPSGSLSD